MHQNKIVFVLLVTLVNLPRVEVLELKVLHGPYHAPPVYRICKSHIYCQGGLLEAVQLSNIFNSSKEFVDMQLLQDEADILKDFNELKSKNNGSISESLLREFVENNFKPMKLEKWLPPDFNNFPPILNRVKDQKYKEFMSGANQMWKILARKVSTYVNMTAERNSMVYVPNGFFVNIENQEEFYYWDSYWIMRGALLCGMFDTVKGILENFIHLIKKFGFVIAANRVYFQGRSQFPVLTQMMASYYTYTKDEKFLLDNLEFLDDEMMFWLIYRIYEVKDIGNVYEMAHYMSDMFDPRPEMYKADVSIAQTLNSTKDKQEFWCRTKATTETGWGFSSKHFHNRNNYEDVRKTLLKTNPLNFVYVELNAILQSNANILSEMFKKKRDEVNAKYYRKMARRFQIGINALLWNEEENMWLDFDTSTGESRNYFYASNLAPLWTGSYDEKLSEFYGDAAVDYLIRNKIINDDLTPRCICVPTSFYNTGLEWDNTNCMPHLQAMVIFGLYSTKSERAQRVALHFASSWAYTTYFEYKQTKTIKKKYDSIQLRIEEKQWLPTNEYQTQACGVTIGLLFEIFNTWGDILQAV